MAKKKSRKKKTPSKTPSGTGTRRGRRVTQRNAAGQPDDYRRVLTDLTRLIGESRRRAAATVNRSLVLLYWQIGAVIVRQQEQAKWGDAVVEQLAADLRAEFPDMKGLSTPNIWRTRQFFLACRDIDRWLGEAGQHAGQDGSTVTNLAPALRESKRPILASALRETASEIISTLSRHLPSPDFAELVVSISWTHHTVIFGATDTPAERYFYLKMAVRERWSVRELRRQIDSALFLRYVSVREHPEKCLPEDAESGDLLPFKDHYVLEFLGLEEEHSERELRHAILANLRDFFLEFGRELSFVGEEYPLTIGNETFSIDLLFFHRRLQCLIAVDLKKGKFKPEYVGKSCFYCAALDEQIRLPHENPSIGLVLCKSADSVQVRLALTAAADRIGVATYQTGLPDTDLIERRLAQFRLEAFPGESDSKENKS